MVIVEETAGLSALGFFKKKKKKKPAPEPDAETSAAARGITGKLGPARLGPDGQPIPDGAGGAAGGAGYLPFVFIGGALLVVGVAGYFILRK